MNCMQLFVGGDLCMGQLLGVRIRVKSLLPRAQVSSMGTNIDISLIRCHREEALVVAAV